MTMPSTTVMTDIIVKIMMEVLFGAWPGDKGAQTGTVQYVSYLIRFP